MSRNNDLLISTDFRDGGLPVLVTPSVSNDSSETLWKQYEEQIKQISEEYLPSHGGILFRGFQQQGNDASCKSFANLFSDELLSYEFGSTPRTDLGQGVYTATEYPAHQIIPLHNEQAYTLQWPLNIWFHCVKASDVGGETPIADSRKICLGKKYSILIRKIRWRNIAGHKQLSLNGKTMVSCVQVSVAKRQHNT